MDGDKPVGTRNTETFRSAKRKEGAVRQEIYLPGPLTEAIDAFRDSQRIASRPEAIRRLCELGLKAAALRATVRDVEALLGPPNRAADAPAAKPEVSARGGRR